MSDEPQPELQGSSIADILAAPDLTREQKIYRLREMAYDAFELEVASGEGMMGEPPNLESIHEALRRLGVDDVGRERR